MQTTATVDGRRRSAYPDDMLQIDIEPLLKRAENLLPAWVWTSLFACLLLFLTLYICSLTVEKVCQVFLGHPSHVYASQFASWFGSFLSIIPDRLLVFVSAGLIVVLAFFMGVVFLHLTNIFLARFTENTFERSIELYFQQREELEKKEQELKALERRLRGPTYTEE